MTAGTPRDGGPPQGGPTSASVAAPRGIEHARAVADAVLYEGYLLYPYRRSSAKNRVRWQFGVLSPQDWVAALGPPDTGVAGSADGWCQQTECLLEAPDPARVRVVLRFLQFQHRGIERFRPDGSTVAVDALEVDGDRHLTFEEAVEHEVAAERSVAELRAGRCTLAVDVPGGLDVEVLADRAGVPAGRVLRRRRPLAVTLTVELGDAGAPFRLHRLRVRAENAVTGVDPGLPRADVLPRSLLAAHCLLGTTGGRFLSLLDPPAWAAEAAGRCVNVHTFPVLAGEPSGTDALLSSPIILYDGVQLAPESPGPLYDSGEIDEILSLRTQALTEEEKREARATDPRAAALLDRVDGLPEEVLARLHGAVRSLRPVAAPEQPWWESGADDAFAPDRDAVVVDGVPVSRGTRVRLRPRRRGTDVHDVFLDGRRARVEKVFLDVDGSRHVAVTLEDDPGIDLHQWYGRFYYFAPEELIPVADPPGEEP